MLKGEARIELVSGIQKLFKGIDPDERRNILEEAFPANYVRNICRVCGRPGGGPVCSVRCSDTEKTLGLALNPSQ